SGENATASTPSLCPSKRTTSPTAPEAHQRARKGSAVPSRKKFVTAPQKPPCGGSGGGGGPGGGGGVAGRTAHAPTAAGGARGAGGGGSRGAGKRGGRAAGCSCRHCSSRSASASGISRQCLRKGFAVRNRA